MSELDRWLRYQAERQTKVMTLQDAVLGNRSRKYGWVRLRYFTLRLTFAAALQAIKVAFLYQVFSQSEFIAVLLLQTSVSLAGSFWWGLLELMRERVRDLFRSGKPHRISEEIGAWLTLALQISLVSAIAGVSWAVWHTLAHGFAAADLYILAVLLSCPLGISARCYHSGIYALRRIYRPPLAIVSIELASFGAVLAMWPWFGAWSLPLGGIVSTLAATAVMVYYTQRTYSFFRFNPLRFVRIRHFRSPLRGTAGDALGCGLAHSIMSMDSLLVFTLFAGSTGNVNGVALFTIFFAVSPLVRAAADWARLFYFDLKRLEIRPFGNIRLRFEQQILRLIWPVSLLLWAFAMLVATLVFRTNLGGLYGLTLPFFLTLSLLAAAQVQAFSRRAYLEVLMSGCLVVAGFVVQNLLVTDESLRLLAFSAIMLAAFFLLRARHGLAERQTESRQLLWPVEWLARIRNQQTPVRIATAKLVVNRRDGQARRTKADLWRITRIADRVAARLGPKGGVTVVGLECIVWYEEASLRRLVDEGWILELGAGSFESICSTQVQANGLAALNAALAQEIVPKMLEGLSGSPEPVSLADLKARFALTFPDGVVYDPDDPAAPPRFDELSSEERGRVWRDAVEFARGTELGRGESTFEVTAFCPGGELRAIFLVDREVTRHLRYRWRRTIRRLNLCASLGRVA